MAAKLMVGGCLSSCHFLALQGAVATGLDKGRGHPDRQKAPAVPVAEHDD